MKSGKQGEGTLRGSFEPDDVSPETAYGLNVLNAVTQAASVAAQGPVAAPHPTSSAGLNAQQPVVDQLTTTASFSSAADAAANAAAYDAIKNGPLSVFDSSLASLYLANSPQAALYSAFTAGNGDSGAVITSGGTQYVVIDATSKDGDGAALLKQLQDAGLLFGSSFNNIASGVIPVDKLADLLGVTDLAFARESLINSHAGVVTTQADSAQHNDTARTTFTVDGTGLKIGVISDSFNRTAPVTASAPGGDDMAHDITVDDLPGGGKTTILQDDTVHSGLTDEGRGMAQLIHDLAPGADIRFATGEFGIAGFATNILQLAADGAKIIVDDLRYFAELAYQPDALSQAVSQVVASGVTYFSSAGNYSVNGYEGAWVAGAPKTIGTTSGGVVTEQFMQFAPGQDYLVNNHTFADIIVLEWDQPSDSASGPSPGATGDLDLFLTNLDGSIVYRKAITNNIGHDAVEVMSDASGLGVNTFYIRVGLHSGVAPGQIKIIDYRNPNDPVASNTNTGTVYGHTAADGAIGVAAADYVDTPQFGTTPPVVESFSSGGPTVQLFDVNGNRLATPIVHNAPQITAVDGGDTSFFPAGAGNDPDSTGFPNFYGTSAAAPDAAATAALMLQKRPALTPADVLNLLRDSAIDMDDPSQPGIQTGFDTRTGAGLIQADKAVGFASTLNFVATAANPLMLGTHLVDTFSGGAENDTFTGFGAIDTLTYAPGGKADTFSDFAAGTGGDVINLTAYTNITSLQAVLNRATQPGADTIINLGSGDTITLSGVTKGNLTLANFVLAPDHAPVITSNGGGITATTAIPENTTAVTTVVASDPDEATTLTYSIVGGADLTKFQIVGGVLSFITAPDFENPASSNNNNTYVVQVRASDGTLSDDQTITVNVTNANDPPIVTGTVTLTSIGEDSGARLITQAQLLGNATDQDGPSLTAVNLTIATGSGSLVNNNNGTWSFTPALNDDTAVSFNYQVTDGTTAVADSATLDITPVNDAPVVGGSVALTAITEDSGARLITQAQLLGNVSDVDGPSLTATGLAIATGGGTLVNNNNGTWSYTPALNDDTSVTFSYQVTDGVAAPVADSATLDITPVNDAPVVNGSVTLTAIAENSGARLITQAQLLGNASDVDGPSLTAVNLAIATGSGTLVNNNNGTWSYTPAPHDDTSVSFSYQVTDGTTPIADSATLDILPFNDPPVVTGSVTLTAIAEDSGARLITQAELLANASDIDGPPLTAINLAIATGGGTLVNNNNGTWSYTPAVNDDTAVSFSYQVTDGIAAPVADSATLDITPVDDPPTSGPVTLAAIAEDSGARLITQAQLLVNAGDVDGPALAAINLAIASGLGTLVDNNDGTWSYTPATHDDTGVTFSYQITDSIAAPPTAATATLDITPINNAPVVNGAVTLAAIAEDSGARLITQAELLSNASDIDGPSLTAINLMIAAGSGSLVDNHNGTWSFTPSANDDTAVSISYQVTDGSIAVADSATLDITPVNDAPVVSGVVTLAAIAENSGARLITQAELVSNASDIDGPSLTAINLAIAVGSGSLVDNHNGTWSYTPALHDDTAVSFSYQVTDGTTAVMDSAALDITPVNDTPLFDFNSDGHGDILFQNVNGTPAVWLMNGTSVTVFGAALPNPNAGLPDLDSPGQGGDSFHLWREISSADFDGDGHSDILWQNNDGRAAVWLMNGTNVSTFGAALPNPDPTWHAKEAADFNGDGKADILWQNDNGTAAVWLMNGTSVSSFGPALPNPGPTWHEMAAADFNGDGKADILWQNDNGAAAVWLMDGTNVTNFGPALPNPGPTWHAKAAADFNGDGKADILWQNDDGTPAVWLMNGVNVTNFGPALPNPGPAWHVKEAEDFNGDGKADILFQHDDGTPAVWLMDGTNVSVFGPGLPNPTAAWHVI